MEKIITNPDGKEFRVTRVVKEAYGPEPIVVFDLASGQTTGASYYLSSLMEEPHDLGLYGAIPEWWVSRENILEAVGFLFSPAELEKWVK